MCLQCVFSSFSTDSGCTVELVDSSTTLVHYSTVFNRSTNIAEGCITDVTSGLVLLVDYMISECMTFQIEGRVAY